MRLYKSTNLKSDLSKQKVAILGAGSWGTAIVSIITENSPVSWWVRRESQKQTILQEKKNKAYLPDLSLNTNKINMYSSLEKIIVDSDIIIIAIPSEYLETNLEPVKHLLSGKVLVSAVKGVLPNLNLTPYQYFKTIPNLDYGVISGPCHAEEVAQKKKSYLTISFKDINQAEKMLPLFYCAYINVKSSNDILGTELAAILKNIYALITGVCNGLGYGDNFLAVIITASTNEMKRLLTLLDQQERSISKSPYLGDLLVTCYSLHSRNRRFGSYIGKGLNVGETKSEMKMVAEGYNATKCIYHILLQRRLISQAPIVKASYDILYNSANPKTTIGALSNIIH